MSEGEGGFNDNNNNNNNNNSESERLSPRKFTRRSATTAKRAARCEVYRPKVTLVYFESSNDSNVNSNNNVEQQQATTTTTARVLSAVEPIYIYIIFCTVERRKVQVRKAIMYASANDRIEDMQNVAREAFSITLVTTRRKKIKLFDLTGGLKGEVDLYRSVFRKESERQ